MTIKGHLDDLEAAGLIRLAADHPDLEYLFRHGLIQDAAYSTLLRQQRRAWHRAAGEALEALPGAAEALAPVLAQHFSNAGDDERARRYFMRAADAAYERYALAEAGDYYARALALATAAPTAAPPADVRYLAERYGLTLELRSRFDDALRHYAAMETLARQHDNQALELAMLLEQAKVYATANLSYDPTHSRALLERAAPLAEQLGDHATQARLLWTLMLQNLFRGGDPEERQAYGEQALALARGLDLREQMAFVLQDLWFAYGGLRPWEETRTTLAEARQLWTELDYPIGLCEVTGRLALIDMFMGEDDRSLALSGEAYAVAERIHSPDMQALSHAFVGLIYTERGDYALAIELGEAAVARGAPTGNVTVLVGTQSDLGLAYAELGDLARGFTLAQAAHQVATTQFPILIGWSGAVLARLHLRRGDVAEAATVMGQLEPYQTYQRLTGFMAPLWTHCALAEAELALAQGQAARAAALMAEFTASLTAIGQRFRLPEALYLRGRALLAQGRLAQARSELQAARLEAIALDSRRVQWRILAALADIEERTGQPDQANVWRHQARRLIDYIAEHAPEALRESFRAQAARLLSPQS